ncbi:unnamed protein product [Ixodes pacificus]
MTQRQATPACSGRSSNRTSRGSRRRFRDVTTERCPRDDRRGRWLLSRLSEQRLARRRLKLHFEVDDRVVEDTDDVALGGAPFNDFASAAPFPARSREVHHVSYAENGRNAPCCATNEESCHDVECRV